jgi:phosphatidylglycerol lysyltransferase
MNKSDLAKDTIAKKGWFLTNLPVWVISSLTLINGILDLFKGIFIRFSENPHFFTLPAPFGFYHLSRILTLIFGFFLTYLSFHLFQRRRTAWWLAVIILIPVIILHIGHGRHLYLALLPLFTLAFLLIFRPRFSVRSEPRNIAQGIRFMALSLISALVFGIVGFYFLDKREFGIEFNLFDSLIRTLREYLMIGNNDLVPQTRQAHWFLDALDIAGITGLVFAVYSLFRPIAFRLRTLTHERARAAEILQQYGRTPEHYFTTLPDKSYFFSPDNSGYIAYRAASGIAVVLSDPVAPEPMIAKLVQDFMNYCTGNGWKVSFLYVPPDFLPIYDKLGLRAMRIGADAIVNLEHFCSQVITTKQFRKVKRRLEEDGYHFKHYTLPHSTELIDQVESVSHEWLSTQGKRERSFAMRPFTRDYAAQTPLFVVLNEEDQAVAFVNETPTYQPGRATIDMMRHRLGLPHGIMDYLFNELFCILYQEGYKTFNLGLAPMAGVGEKPDATIEERIIRLIFELLSRYLPYEGLRTYKSKFEPSWEDRYLVYQGGPQGLVRIGTAIFQILR